MHLAKKINIKDHKMNFTRVNEEEQMLVEWKIKVQTRNVLENWNHKSEEN